MHCALPKVGVAVGSSGRSRVSMPATPLAASMVFRARGAHADVHRDDAAVLGLPWAEDVRDLVGRRQQVGKPELRRSLDVLGALFPFLVRKQRPEAGGAHRACRLGRW
eukprot:3040792-Pyramimonas_sp.AAC.1